MDNIWFGARRFELWSQRVSEARGAARVLVADDCVDIADSLREVFAHKGFHSRSVYLGEHAALMAIEWRPHFVLLDISMADMDGLEVARRVRAGPRGGEPVLFAHTALSADDIRDEAKAAGFDAFVGQPASPRMIARAFEWFGPRLRADADLGDARRARPLAGASSPSR